MSQISLAAFKPRGLEQAQGQSGAEAPALPTPAPAEGLRHPDANVLSGLSASVNGGGLGGRRPLWPLRTRFTKLLLLLKGIC